MRTTFACNPPPYLGVRESGPGPRTTKGGWPVMVQWPVRAVQGMLDAGRP